MAIRLPVAVGLLLVLAGAVGVVVWVGTHADPEGVETPAAPELVAIERVIDGDTIRLRDGRRVRLAQIDTPELTEGECYSDTAGAALMSLVPAEGMVSLVRDAALDDSDRFGRLIRYVFDGQRNLNLELVRSGAAAPWFVDGNRGRYARRLVRAARRARRRQLGMWHACPDARLDPTRGVQTGLVKTGARSALP